MKANYNFSKGKRGKYARQYAAGTNLVVLAPDVAKIYKDTDTVNEALRALVKIAALKKQRVA